LTGTSHPEQNAHGSSERLSFASQPGAGRQRVAVDERVELNDLDDLPQMGRLRPRMEGHGLALPPLTTLAGVAGVIAGLIVGLQLIAGPTTVTPVPSPTDPALTFLPEETALPVEYPELPTAEPAPVVEVVQLPPPRGGLSLDQALEALYHNDPVVWSGRLLSASLEYRGVVSYEIGASVAGLWSLRYVWVFTIDPWTAHANCGAQHSGTNPELCLPLGIRRVEMDYLTGECLGVSVLF
jgi:hypothetical protein